VIRPQRPAHVSKGRNCIPTDLSRDSLTTSKCDNRTCDPYSLRESLVIEIVFDGMQAWQGEECDHTDLGVWSNMRLSSGVHEQGESDVVQARQRSDLLCCANVLFRWFSTDVKRQSRSTCSKRT
jgi:hypothetical protein